ncbi:MAG: PAS domain S-box protein [Rhodocyclaceae bacterium]|nr:PAS domain S-box protein [Rhodocyclaceae bacterium]MCE2897639.1 PAS domain S-box protein [Betaproteobacteria bacterium]
MDLDARGDPLGSHSGDESLLSIVLDTEAMAPSESAAPRLHPDVAPIIHSAVRECAASGKTIVRNLAAGQSREHRSIEATLSPRRVLGDESPSTYCLMLRDLAGGESWSRLLKQLAQVASSTSNLVVVCNAHRRIEWVNHAFTAATGYTLDEVQGCSPGTLLQFDRTDPGTVAEIRRALDARQPVHTEILNRSKSGREYWLSLDIQPVLGDDGTLEGFVAVQMDVTEQKRQTHRLMELAHDASAARNTLLTAVSALPDGFALFNAEERLVLCNEKYRTLHPTLADSIMPGVTVEELLKRELALGEYPEARGREQQWLCEKLGSLRTKNGWAHDLELTDGRWVRSVKLRVAGDALVAMRSDITQLKRAERSAVAQRAVAMDASRDGIATANAEGRLTYVNSALLTMFGEGAAQGWLGRHWSELCHPADRDSLSLSAHRTLSAEGVWRAVIRALRSDGAQFSQEVSLTRAPDDSLVLISRDVSERLRYEEDRQRLQETMILERVEHEARLESALVEMKRLQERDASMRQASEMLVRALQSLSEAEDLGDGPRHLLQQLAQAMRTSCAGLIPLGPEEEPLCLHHPAWWGALQQNNAVLDYLARRPRRLIGDVTAVPLCAPIANTWPDEKLAWMATARITMPKSGYLLVLAGGGGDGLLHSRAQLFVRFVPLLTEALRRRADSLRARKLEQDLLQAQKLEALGTLAGGIAHEINTPMQYISDNLHFLKDRFAEVLGTLEQYRRNPNSGRERNPELDYILEEIPLALDQSLNGSKRVAEIVEAVRTFAYPELATNESFDLGAVLEHCLVMTRSQWKHELTVSLQRQGNSEALRGSPGQIGQVFVNLMTNACDAVRMSSDGRSGLVRIGLIFEEGEAVVHVDDNGPGIPAALHERIFDPFFTTKALGKGTGQGLSICRSIVERHGGSISHDRSPLGGARFTVRLPLVPNG